MQIGRLYATFKVLYFVPKNEWPVGYKFQNFVIPYKKRMAIWVQFYISYFAVKKRMAAWVHAFG